MFQVEVDLDGRDNDSVTSTFMFHLFIYAFITFHISVPVFPIGQVHVDVCTQLCRARGEHTEDFVLVKSSFLKAAH